MKTQITSAAWTIRAVALVAWLVLPSAVHAAVIQFADKATFLAATGATDATGAIPDLGAGVLVDPRTIGSVEINAVTWFSDSAFPWTDLIPGNEISVGVGLSYSYLDDINATFAAPVFSAGFDFVEYVARLGPFGGCGDGLCVDSTFQVTLRNAGSFVDQFVFNAPNDVAAFVGVWSPAAFDMLEIRETVGCGAEGCGDN